MLGEVLAALLPGDAEISTLRECPFAEGTERYDIYCAAKYAMAIGNDDGARKILDQLGGPRSRSGLEQAVMRERIVRPRKR